MTSIRMRWSRLEMKIDGHADWGPKGADLVCCAVLTLLMAADSSSRMGISKRMVGSSAWMIWCEGVSWKRLSMLMQMVFSVAMYSVSSFLFLK